MRIRIKLLLCALGTFLLLQLSGLLYGADFPAFEERTIDPAVGKVCYAVTVADVNGDGRPDAVALSENRLLWYENPSWTPHVILDQQLEMDHVCLAPLDVNGDGAIDFAVGAGWLNKHIGSIQWIERDPQKPDGLWKVHLIGQESWLHRMRFADALGTGQPQLVISPLNRTQGDGVRLTAFAIPERPAEQRWPATVIDDTMNRMHNHWHADVDSDGRTDTLTASQEGVHLLLNRPDGFTKLKISTGAEGDQPAGQGAGEIKYGHLGEGTPLIATVEPMHGNQIVVYRQTGDGLSDWSRLVLDNTMGRGHGLWLADMDGDGRDEVVIGHSDPSSGPIKGPGISIFRAADPAGTQWTRHVLDDGGMATEDLVVADFNGDGRPDVLAGGRATHNVKIYFNQGR